MLPVSHAPTAGVLRATAPQALKQVLNHQRPEAARKSDPGMPSSHATSAMPLPPQCLPACMLAMLSPATSFILLMQLLLLLLLLLASQYFRILLPLILMPSGHAAWGRAWRLGTALRGL
jgi:hypothetical protein